MEFDFQWKVSQMKSSVSAETVRQSVNAYSIFIRTLSLDVHDDFKHFEMA